MNDKGEKGTVAVDFDGVIHSYTSPWAGADIISDPPVPGAIDWLNKIVNEYNIVIFTTRGDQEESNKAVMQYIRDNGYVGPDLLITSKKVPAYVYVDDRAWRFEGNNFPTPKEIREALPWNKK